MRKRVGLIICLFATFSVLSFIVGTVLGEWQGPLNAEASVYKKRSQTVAKGKVYASPSAKHGAYEISVVSGKDYDGDAGHYRNGLSTRVIDAKDYGSNAKATAWISGHDQQGKAWLAQDKAESGG